MSVWWKHRKNILPSHTLRQLTDELHLYRFTPKKSNLSTCHLPHSILCPIRWGIAHIGCNTTTIPSILQHHRCQCSMPGTFQTNLCLSNPLGQTTQGHFVQGRWQGETSILIGTFTASPELGNSQSILTGSLAVSATSLLSPFHEALLPHSMIFKTIGSWILIQHKIKKQIIKQHAISLRHKNTHTYIIKTNLDGFIQVSTRNSKSFPVEQVSVVPPLLLG